MKKYLIICSNGGMLTMDEDNFGIQSLQKTYGIDVTDIIDISDPLEPTRYMGQNWYRISGIDILEINKIDSEKTMTIHLCENNHCTYHREIHERHAKDSYIDTIEHGELVRVKRYLYRNRDGVHEFFLCEACHSAVQMVVTSENQ